MTGRTVVGAVVVVVIVIVIVVVVVLVLGVGVGVALTPWSGWVRLIPWGYLGSSKAVVRSSVTRVGRMKVSFIGVWLISLVFVLV